MSTTGRLAVTHGRRRSITPRAIESTSIPCSIFKPSPASCRPTPIAGTTSSTIPRALRERFRRSCAGAHAGGSSSSWQISRPMPGAARRRRRSHQSPSKRSSAWTTCPIECGINGQSADAGNRLRPLVAALEARLRSSGCASCAVLDPNPSIICCGAGMGLPVPRRWPALPDEQRGGARMRGFVLGRKSWLLPARSAADRAAFMTTLTTMAKLTTSTRKRGRRMCWRGSRIAQSRIDGWRRCMDRRVLEHCRKTRSCERKPPSYPTKWMRSMKGNDYLCSDNRLITVNVGFDSIEEETGGICCLNRLRVSGPE